MDKIKNYKSIIIIGIILIVIIVISIFSCSKKEKTSTTSIIQQNISSEKNLNGTSLQIFKEKIFFPFVTINNDYILGLTDKGTLLSKISLANSLKEIIFKEQILGPSFIAYSPKGDKVIIESNYPEKNIKLYNKENNKISTLNNHIRKIQWSTKSDLIYYSFFDPTSKEWQLNIANPDATNRKELYKTKIDGVDQSAPNFTVSPTEENVLFFSNSDIEKNPKNFVLSLKDNNTFDLNKKYQVKYALWSPDGKKIAFLDNQNRLYLFNLDDKSYYDAKVYTFDYKLSWKDKDTLIVAIPKNYSASYQIYNDDIYVFDVSSKKFSKINLSSNQTLEDIAIIPSTDDIYFSTKDYLYKLKINNLK